jgi:hypothetical protein
VAKSVSPDEALLAGLRKAVEALPAVKPLAGTGGVFPGGAKGKELADRAIAQGLLTAKDERVTSGKRSKNVVFGVLTEKGLRRVVDAASPKAALEALLPAVQALGRQPAPPAPEPFRAELSRATATCVDAIKQAFAKLEGEVLKALAPPAALSVGPGVVLNALQHALERVEDPVFPVVAPEPSGPDPKAILTSVPNPSVEEAIVAFVNGWAREKTVGCQFDVLWNHLREPYPELTVGVFHDSLRKLHDAGRIRLGGWARMLDDLPQPQLALFVSSKVMYYAHPAPPNG